MPPPPPVDFSVEMIVAIFMGERGTGGHEVGITKDEFAFRFNRRKSRRVGMIFFRLTQQGVQTSPVPYRAFVRPVRKHKQ